MMYLYANQKVILRKEKLTMLGREDNSRNNILENVSGWKGSMALSRVCWKVCIYLAVCLKGTRSRGPFCEARGD